MTAIKDKVVESNNLWASLGALIIGAGFVGFLAYNGLETQSSLMWMGFLGLYLTNVIGKQKSLAKGEEMSAKMDDMLNSVMDEKIRNAVRDVLAEVGMSQNGNESNGPVDESGDSR